MNLTGTIRPRLRAPAAALTAIALATAGAALAAGPANASPATASHAKASAANASPKLATPAKMAAAGEPYTCSPNGPAGNQTIYGTFGDSGVIGWTGNSQATVACLGGSFFVDTSPEDAGPGSGSTAAVTGTSYGYGIYNDTKTTWANADGYLPALVTTFQRDGATVAITNFADQDTIAGHRYVVDYSRVAVTNDTGHAITLSPQATPGLTPLDSAPDTVAAHATADHDYAVGANTFGGSYQLPTPAQLTAAGSFNTHFAHMRAYWNAQLAGIAQITALPDKALIDAYKTGFEYTQIIRSGNELKTGANGYDKEFSHDVIGIIANLINQGYTTGMHGLLTRARYVIGTQTQYDDGVWTYPWIWALYLEKTGDLSFVKKNFDTNGPAGATEPSIEATAHLIAADRTGPGGIMEETNDIDADGYWTIDNYEALTGLWTYRYLAQRVGNTAQANWAASQYNSLLAAVNKTLDATIAKYHLNYLPCSMIEPNTDNRCVNAEDANWAAPFLFGRWAWDGYLFGAPRSGPGLNLIDATYDYGFGRLKGKLPANTLGGYPTNFYSTAYNAGYGEWGLASSQHRDQGILGYEFMVTNGQTGPYSWWESQQFPNTGNPWAGTHPEGGGGASPHAWGMANANLTLLDSLAAQLSSGGLVVGRGVPDSWITSGQQIAVKNFETMDGKRTDLEISTSGRTVTLTLGGDAPAGPVQFQLPVFVNDIAATTAGTISERTGTVTIAPSVRTVSVILK